MKPIEGYLFTTDENDKFQLNGYINGIKGLCAGSDENAFVGLTFEKLEEPKAETEKPTETPNEQEPEKPTETPTETPDVNPADKTTFADVPKSEYYYEPVMWAAEQGITGGTGNGKFSPNMSCTRAQVVTFLYRYMSK